MQIISSFGLSPTYIVLFQYRILLRGASNVDTVESMVQPQSLSKCFRRTTNLLHTFGIPIFSDDFSQRRVITVKCALYANLMISLGNLYVVMKLYRVGKWEQASVLFFLLVHKWVAITVILHNRRTVEGILETLFKCLTLKEKKFLSL